MAKNVKRYVKELQRENGTEIAPRGGEIVCWLKSSHFFEIDFLPTTFMLPADYSIFVEEFKRNPNAMWIMKPTGKSQGKGIFIINKLSQIKKWASSSRLL